jgi:hypothetical protein
MYLSAGIAILAVIASKPETAKPAVRNNTVVSTGQAIDLRKALIPEATTVLLFLQDSSSMEQEFLKQLEAAVPEDKKSGIRVVQLKRTDSPVADQFGVVKTPTAIVFDRWGKVLNRSTDVDQIKAAVHKGGLMGRIKWIDEDNPDAPAFYGRPAAMIKTGIPGIVKTMSLRKDVFDMFMQMSNIHFSDGYLKRREHEMIAAYVSGLNKCKF